eukprot:SAG31_NODE_12506_length_936_cov_1.704898_2_plen_148_part_00
MLSVHAMFQVSVGNTAVLCFAQAELDADSIRRARHQRIEAAQQRIDNALAAGQAPSFADLRVVTEAESSDACSDAASESTDDSSKDDRTVELHRCPSVERQGIWTARINLLLPGRCDTACSILASTAQQECDICLFGGLGGQLVSKR